MLTGYTVGGGMRNKIFGKDFMEGNFKQEHDEAFLGQDVPLPRFGNPDMGSGRYAAKLSYKDWFLFNTSQRIHYNYLETVVCVIVWILIGGIRNAWITFGFGVAYLVGRILYNILSTRKGINGRFPAVAIIFACHLGLFVLSILGPVQLYLEGAFDPNVIVSNPTPVTSL
jgi:hypothetical protein